MATTADAPVTQEKLWQVLDKIVVQLSASTNVCIRFKCFNEHAT